MAIWRAIGITAAAAAILSASLLGLTRALRRPAPKPPAALRYVGSDACKDCHAKEYEGWKGSHHALAMLPPGPTSVLGDFDDASFQVNGKSWRFFKRDGKYVVRTDDVAGPPVELEVAATFGWFPLQQYLVPFPGGRLQCLSVAWDVEEKRWFSLYPGRAVPPTDWLHWTRSALNWNAMCSQCHSTGVIKGYDLEADVYDTTWKEISVGCEACHGPASLHLEWVAGPAQDRPAMAGAGLAVKTSAMGAPDLVRLCAPCHSRRGELKDMERPAAEALEAHLPSLLAPGLFYPDGQIQDEVYEVHSFLQSRMYAQGVKCSDCHDVHSGKRREEGNALCLRCHKGETYDTPSHHLHRTTIDGRPADGARCVSCHMPGRSYMVVHYRRDHSLRVPRPDLSRTIGTPNACGQTGCHADRPLSWIVAAYDRRYGTARQPHYGTVLAAARAGEPGARAGLLALAADRQGAAIVRATAVDLLGSYPGDDTTRALEAALMDGDAMVRRAAADRFPAGDVGRLAQALAPLLRDPVLGVRVEAATRLAGLPEGALPESRAAEYTSALEEARSVLAFSGDMPSGRHNLALLEQALGHAGEAERQYRKALAIDDQFYLSAVNLAILLSGQGRNDEAERWLRQAQRVDPRNPAIAFNLGLLLAETGRTREAEEALGAALDVDPRLAAAAYNLAVLVGERDPARAVGLCRRAAEQSPDEPKYAYSRAYYELRQGKEGAATATLEPLVQAHPALGGAVLMLGDLFLRQNRARDAARIYDRALASKELPDRDRAAIATRRRALP